MSGTDLRYLHGSQALGFIDSEVSKSFNIRATCVVLINAVTGIHSETMHTETMYCKYWSVYLVVDTSKDVKRTKKSEMEGEFKYMYTSALLAPCFLAHSH